jgi:lauroyl/myristoyl acyltransferase
VRHALDGAIRARFEIVNGELLDAGLARGKGVYALLSHHGPHHITGLTMSLMGYRVAGIRDPNEGPLRTYIQSLWTKRHTELTPAKVLYTTDFVRGIYRLLRDNYALGSALDVSRVRDERLKTMPVRIYGEQREFLTGTLQIALRCRAAIVQAFIVAEDGFRYRLEFLGPMADPDRESESDALLGTCSSATPTISPPTPAAIPSRSPASERADRPAGGRLRVTRADHRSLLAGRN